MRDDIDTAALVPEAVAGGVAFVPGTPFFVDGSGRNTMRLTFAKEPDSRIREGIKRLAGVLMRAATGEPVSRG
jgi:DNA-binding transcriptional MocR family regulator